MNPTADFQAIGEAFLNHYYHCFDSRETRKDVMHLYSPDALLTFEGDQCKGHDGICEKLTCKFQIGCIKRVLTKIDCQPMPDGIIVFVFGQLIDHDSQDKPMGFTQMFMLRCVGQSFLITNEIFRLVLHDIAA